MQFEDFGLTIRGSIEEANGYVVMSHGQHYEVVLSNDRPLRCNAALFIDGKEIGVFRIEGRSSITLERPLHDEGRFTFYNQNSLEGQAVALPSSDVLGLIQATFTPERQAIKDPLGYEWTQHQQWPDRIALSDDIQDAPEPSPAPSPSRSYEAGGTGLSGHSQQQFDGAEAIDLDKEAEVTISLRLVAQNREMPRPLTSIRSTPVPPPI